MIMGDRGERSTEVEGEGKNLWLLLKNSYMYAKNRMLSEIRSFEHCNAKNEV